MFKKLVLASAILAVSSGIAYANGAPYVGTSIGVKNTNGGRYLPLDVFAGYGSVVSPGFYLGGELNADLTSFTLSNNNGLKTTYGLGASIIPGMMLSNSTMFYGRAGVVRSKFSSKDKLANGGQLGLGIQTNLTQCWDLRGEYTYTAYKSVGGVSSPKADQFNLAAVYKFE